MTEEESCLAGKLRLILRPHAESPVQMSGRFLYTDLVRDFVGLQPSDFNVDNEVYAGRVYSILGNLVVAFNRNLHWQIKEAELQIHKYMAYLKSRRPGADYFATVTDGLHFHVYLPQYNETGEVVRLKKTYGLNLPSPMTALAQATNDLGVNLSPISPNYSGKS